MPSPDISRGVYTARIMGATFFLNTHLYVSGGLCSCRVRRIDSNHRVLALTHRSKGMAASCINTENVMIALSEMS
jgi:hypothetical protein